MRDANLYFEWTNDRVLISLCRFLLRKYLAAFWLDSMTLWRHAVDVSLIVMSRLYQKTKFISIIHTQIHYYGLSQIAIKTSIFNYQSRKTNQSYLPFQTLPRPGWCACAHQPKPSSYKSPSWHKCISSLFLGGFNSSEVP